MPKKIEVVNIDFGFDIAEAIKSKADAINSDTILYTKKLIENMPKQSQKHLEDQKKKERIQEVTDFMIENSKDENWVTSVQILKTAGFTKSQELNKLIMQVNKGLKETGKYELLKKRKNHKTVYRIVEKLN